MKQVTPAETLAGRAEMVLRPSLKNGDSRQPLSSIACHPALPSQPLTVLNLLLCLRRLWKRALTWGAVAGLVTLLAIVIFLPPAKPSAFSKVYFPPNPSRSLFGNQEIPLNVQTQKELLLSSKILEQVLKTPEIAELEIVREKPNPKQWLSRELHLDFPTGSEIMRITLYGDRTDDLVAIVDAVTMTYLSTVGNDSSAQREKQLAHYESLYQKSKDEFNQLYSEMMKKGYSVGSTDSKTIAVQIQLVADQLKAKRSEANVMAKRLDELKRELETAQKKVDEPIDRKDPVFESLLALDTEVVALQMERRVSEKKRDADLPFLGPDHPDRLKHKSHLERVQKQLDARIAELRPAIESRVHERFRADLEKLEQETGRMQSQYRLVKEEITQLDGESSRLKSAVASVEGKRPELQDKENEVNRYKGLMQRLKNELDAPFRGEVLEAATLVIPNETNRRFRFGFLGFVLVSGLVVVGFAFWEYRAHRIASSDDVAQHLGLSVLGTVPDHGQPASSTGPTTASINWENLRQESVDSTRTLLMHTAEKQGLRHILIASAVSNEGKTSVAEQLARSLARAGRKVILIDGDLRSPSLHSLFGLSIKPGVCEYLRGEATADDIIQPTGAANLFVITTGLSEPSAVQHLAMNGFHALLEELRSEADFTLIDSSPVLPVADALLMARHVDGVLLSLMCDVSRIERVNMAIHKLHNIGAHLIGAILNGSAPETYGYAQTKSEPKKVRTEPDSDPKPVLV